MTNANLDALDKKLIGLLAEDARISNRKIAADLDVTEGTVRSRIKRLERDNLIRFTAITTLSRGERFRIAFIRVQAELEKIPDICKVLEPDPNIGALIVTMGRFNLLAITIFNDLDSLHAMASDKILSLPGVHHVETAIAISTVKYDLRVARIL
ncbi:MAG: AsnC family transcriptional regulator [Sphingomonas sp.]|nr:AsnC family transcriptional regulator [Sphingomonas sp.]